MNAEHHDLDPPARLPPNRFTLRQLECFVAVAETGSISTAAAELRASDSAVSDAITSMERGLGASLFQRKRARGATLTSDGLAILPIARRMLADAEELAATAGRDASSILGPVRVGATDTLAPVLLPGIIHAVGDRYPGVKIYYRTGDVPTLLTALDDAELDIVVTYDIDIPPELGRAALFSTEACLVVAADHPLAVRSEVSLAEVADDPMVLLDIESSRVHTLELMSARGITPRIAHRTANYELCRSLVGRGFGYTLLMWRDIGRHTWDGAEVAMLRITPRPRRVDVLLVWAARPQHPRLSSFIEATRELYASGPNFQG